MDREQHQYIPASDVIDTVCRELKYSRSHVAKILRENRRRIGARLRRGRWEMPLIQVGAFSKAVKKQSGRRYRLRETGPHKEVS